MHRINLSIPLYLPTWLYSFLWRLRGREVRAADTASGLNLLGDRDIEWSWIASQIPDGGGEALDLGSGNSCLGLVAAQKGFKVTAIDLLSPDWYFIHPDLHFVQGDILGMSLPTEQFDLVINCSTVEHIGLAGRYGITDERPDGDLEAMSHLLTLLKPGASMLLTIPVGEDAIFAPATRIYGRERMPGLLKGYVVEKEEYWAKEATNQWVQVEKSAVLSLKATAGASDALKDLYAIGNFVLRRPGITEEIGNLI